jgi:hypothetical protein
MLRRLDVERTRLVAIDGQVPSLLATPLGCRFAPRCPFADDACRAEEPLLRPVDVDGASLAAAVHAADTGATVDSPPSLADHAVACRKAPLDPDRLARERLAAEVAA